MRDSIFLGVAIYRGFVFEKDTSKTRHLCYSTIHVWGFSFWVNTRFESSISQHSGLDPVIKKKSSRHVVSMFAAFKPASNDMCPL